MGPVVPDPPRVILVVVQVRVAGFPALARGTSLLDGTVTLTVLVQPFSVLVTVRVYVPPWLTVGNRVFSPETILPLLVDHSYVNTGPVEDPAPLMLIVGV